MKLHDEIKSLGYMYGMCLLSQILHTIMFKGFQPPLQWQPLQWDILHPLDMSKRVQVFFVTARLAFQGTYTQTHLAKLQDQ